VQHGKIKGHVGPHTHSERLLKGQLLLLCWFSQGSVCSGVTLVDSWQQTGLLLPQC
jgi:hypothetical protein